MNIGFCKRKRPKLILIEKSHNIIQQYLQVDNIIKKLLEFELLKKLYLGNLKAMIFGQNLRKLNV
jgi:hypothetical protein